MIWPGNKPGQSYSTAFQKVHRRFWVNHPLSLRTKLFYRIYLCV
jgi:hypothetical protein